MPEAGYGRRLATAALSYAVLHHLGVLPDGLGSAPEGTRWADWLDLAVPWLVLAPAAATLASTSATPRQWAVLACGAVAYASGHGIHLAANSVGNTAPGPTAHLWDEAVGHLVWYAGVALVLAALAGTMRDRPRPTGAAAVVGAGWSWRHRRGLGVLALVASSTAVVVLVALLVG
ncbi:hypothetical protein AB0N29_05190 [Nocardioides sp. NPDC092400]|uniref:hypothetical protein n=1 Tax=Nocardioides sp. NPDC092400 TaxID=3155196 RepID=UPI003428C799